MVSVSAPPIMAMARIQCIVQIRISLIGAQPTAEGVSRIFWVLFTGIELRVHGEKALKYAYNWMCA